MRLLVVISELGALAGQGVEEPGVQDVSKCAYEICARCTALYYDDESFSSFALALWKEMTSH